MYKTAHKFRQSKTKSLVSLSFLIPYPSCFNLLFSFSGFILILKPFIFVCLSVKYQHCCYFSWVLLQMHFNHPLGNFRCSLSVASIYISFWFFFFFWLCWVFVAVCGLSLVVARGGYSSLRCVGFSLRWLLLLRSTGSRSAGFSNCGTWAQ